MQHSLHVYHLIVQTSVPPVLTLLHETKVITFLILTLPLYVIDGHQIGDHLLHPPFHHASQFGVPIQSFHPSSLLSLLMAENDLKFC